jgi:hypothetical protein
MMRCWWETGTYACKKYQDGKKDQRPGMKSETLASSLLAFYKEREASLKLDA